MFHTKNSVPEKARSLVLNLLQDRLGEAIDLRSQAKQAHWNVRGLSFFSLHKLFDEISVAVDNHADLIAERIVQLGGVAEGTVRSAAKRSALPVYPLKVANGRDHLHAISHGLGVFGELTRNSIEKLDEVSDPATADILTGILRETDKYLWMVEAHTQTDH